MLATMLILFFIFLFLNMPIAFAMSASAIITLVMNHALTPQLVAMQINNAASNFTLAAIPFFILAGSLMKEGGVSKRIIAFTRAMVGTMPGGTGMVAIVASMIFAAISGSGPATVAALGIILVPAMIHEGYDVGYAAGLQAASGGLGVVIPPSVPMLLFSMLTGASVGTLFIAGFIPGILMGCAMMLVNYYFAKKRGYVASKTRVSFKEFLIVFKDSLWALLMPVIIIGGIYTGVFTPTEAACVAVVYGFIIGVFVYREIKLKDFKTIMLDAASISAISVILLAMADGFSWVLTVGRIQILLGNFVANTFSSPIPFLLTIMVIYLIIGCFMSSNAAMIIMAPILAPIAVGFGVDLIHFGLIMVVCLELGMVTPPFGVNLFVASSIAKIQVDRIVKGVAPFILACIFVLIFIVIFPGITLFLPRIMGMIG